jgi:hypothetical protein
VLPSHRLASAQTSPSCPSPLWCSTATEHLSEERGGGECQRWRGGQRSRPYAPGVGGGLERVRGGEGSRPTCRLISMGSGFCGFSDPEIMVGFGMLGWFVAVFGLVLPGVHTAAEPGWMVAPLPTAALHSHSTAGNQVGRGGELFPGNQRRRRRPGNSETEGSAGSCSSTVVRVAFVLDPVPAHTNANPSCAEVSSLCASAFAALQSPTTSPPVHHPPILQFPLRTTYPPPPTTTTTTTTSYTNVCSLF